MSLERAQSVYDSQQHPGCFDPDPSDGDVAEWAEVDIEEATDRMREQYLDWLRYDVKSERGD